MKNLSKYGYARIIGARALQLYLGAPPLIKLGKKLVGPIEIAVYEFNNGVMNLTVLDE